MTPLHHPTAQIDPTAQLGRGVRVGPGAVIEANCVIGDDCEIRANAILTGSCILGSANQIGYSAVIGAEPQDLSYKKTPSRVVMGNRNVIREHVTIHRGTTEGSETIVGDDNFLMAGAHVAHNCQIGNQVIMANNVLLAGYVQVGNCVFLSGGAAMHQHVRIGQMAMVRGLTRVSQDVPPYTMVIEDNQISGINRVGLKRAGLSTQSILEIRRAYRLLFRSGFNTTQGIAELEKQKITPEINTLIEFVRTSKRGICKEKMTRAVSLDADSTHEN